MSTSKKALRVVAIYVAFGLLWILFSDQVLLLVTADVQQLVWLQTAKGWLFVIITAALLYALIVTEMTLLAKTEASLREQEEFFRLIAENSDDFIAVLDPEGRRLYNSPSYRRFFGEGRALRGSDSFAEIHPDDRERIKQMFRETVQTGIGQRTEYRFVLPDGGIRHMESSGGVIRDSQGKTLRVIVVSRDSSERKQTEAALIIHKDRLEQAEAHARLGSWEFDVASGQPWWSAQMYALLGLNPSAGVPSFEDYLACLHPQDRPAVLEVLKRMAAGQPPTPSLYRGNPEHGPTRWLSPTVHCEYDTAGNAIKFSGTVLDVTAIKETETALRESEARLRALIDTIPDLVWLKDPEGIYLFCNTVFERLYGARQADIVGKTDYDFVDAQLADSFRAHDRKAIEAGHPSSNEEWVTFAEDGYRGLLETIKTPVRGPDGQLIGVLGISRDITALRETQEKLRELNAELELRVAERTAEWQTVNQSLESFVYSVSHDLKTPLRGVEGYSRLLQEDFAGKLDDEGRLFIANIRAGVARMNELIDDLLAYSRMERRRLNAGPLELDRLLDSLLAEHGEEFASRGVRIERTLPPLNLSADADGLVLVVRNLLENALKFSSQSARPRIEIGARQENGNVILWIKDNGIGFDMKYHDRIFEIFQRLHRQEDYPGTGIGLALVKKAMQRMGGKVWAESAPGAGATFYLELPNPAAE
ncbi:MAG: PAS domain S-box protein [Gallionellaceae bacterium]|nr:PAS domain S-box protein [Gallionellaceae bacterium]